MEGDGLRPQEIHFWVFFYFCIAGAEVCCSFHDRGRIHSGYRSRQRNLLDDGVRTIIGFEARQVCRLETA